MLFFFAEVWQTGSHSSMNCSFQLLPQSLYRIQGRTLTVPLQNLDFISLQLFRCQLDRVFGNIVLLHQPLDFSSSSCTESQNIAAVLSNEDEKPTAFISAVFLEFHQTNVKQRGHSYLLSAIMQHHYAFSQERTALPPVLSYLEISLWLHCLLQKVEMHTVCQGQRESQSFSRA